MTELVSLVSRRIKFLWTLKRFSKNIVKTFVAINMKNIQKPHHVVNVWCKYFFLEDITLHLPLFPFILATHARCFIEQKNGQSSCGTPQSQTVVVRVVMVLSTKLILSLTLSTLRMNVKQQRLQSAGFYQVNKLKLGGGGVQGQG